MKFTAALFITLLLFACSTTAQAYSGKNKSYDKSPAEKSGLIQSEAGYKIPEWGLAIDAFYYPEHDHIIPGYKILMIVVTNNRTENIYLNAKKDQWSVIDSTGKKYSTYNHVKEFDKDLWDQMVPEFKQKIDYPHVVRPGRYAIVYVFLKEEAQLFNFRTVTWQSDFFDKKFSILTNYEKNLSVNEDAKDQPIPNEGNISLDEDSLEEDTIYLDPTLKKDKWTEQQIENERIKENNPAKINFDPTFDDAIILSD